VRTPALLLTILGLCLPTLPARAQPAPIAEADVAVGWAGLIRPGRWNPVTATVQAPAPQAGTLEWYVPQEGRQAMVLRQPVALEPRSKTFVGLIPLGTDLRALHLTVRDEAGRTIAHWPDEPLDEDALGRRMVLSENAGARVFVGAAGEGRVPTVSSESAAVGFVDLGQLPATPAGYDALDVLLLDAVPLDELRPDQAAAIARWVSAGGTLWLHPGNEPLPDLSPILALLPDRPGRRIVDGDRYYTPLPGIRGTPAVTIVPAGEGRSVFFHVEPSQVSAGELDLMPRPRVLATDRVEVAPIPWRPPMSWLALAVLLGPIEWLAMRRTRRGPWIRRWLPLPATLAAVVLAGLWIATPAGPHPEPATDWWTLAISDPEADWRDVEATLTGDGLIVE
jgi:hypothetical protein